MISTIYTVLRRMQDLDVHHCGQITQAVEALCRKHGFELGDYTLSVKGRQLQGSALAVEHE